MLNNNDKPLEINDKLESFIINLANNYKNDLDGFILQVYKLLRIRMDGTINLKDNFYEISYIYEIGIYLSKNYLFLHSIRVLEECLKYFNINLEENFIHEDEIKRLRSACLMDIGSSYFSIAARGKAIEYFEKALQIAIEIGDKRQQADAYQSIGTCHYSLSSYSKATENQENALSLAIEIGDVSLELGCYGNLGNIYRALSDFNEAIDYFERGLQMAIDIRDRNSELRFYPNLGLAYYGLKDYPKALEYLEKGLLIATEVGDRGMEGECYKDIGKVYDGLYDYPKALEYLEKGLLIATEVGDRGMEGECYKDIGNVYDGLYDYPKALEYLEKGLLIATEVGDRKRQVMYYRNLGAHYDMISNYLKAIEYHEKALTLAIQVEDKTQKAGCYASLGLAFHSLSDYHKAKEYQEMALSINIELGDRIGEANCYISIGNAYIGLSDYKKAIEYEEKALPIAKRYKNKETEIGSYVNLGTAYGLLYNYPKAIEYQEKALNLAREIKDLRWTSECYVNIGSVYKELTDYRKAIDYYQKALPITIRIGYKTWEGVCYHNLGMIFSAISDYPKAIEYHEKALAIAVSTGGRDSESACYISLGNVHNKLYEFQKAIECYNKALQLAKEMQDSDTLSICYNNLGTAYSLLSDYPKAIEYHEKALILAKVLDNKGREATLYYNLGKIYKSLSDLNRAFEYLKDAVDIYESLSDYIVEDEQKIGFNTKYANFYEDIVDLSLKLDKKREAFEYVERSKAKAFIDLMSKSNLKPTNIENKEMYDLYQKEQQLLKKRNAIQNKSMNKLSHSTAYMQSKTMQDSQDINSITEELNKIYDKMKDIDFGYVSLRRPQQFKLNQAQKILEDNKISYKNNSVLAEYFWTVEKLFIFIVTKNNLYCEIQEYPNILDCMNNYERETVNFPLAVKNGEQITNEWLYSLSKFLIEPLVPYLQKEHTDLVYFIPHGILHKLPLHALLIDSKNQIPLIEKYKVVYSSSASLLQFYGKGDQYKNGKGQTINCKVYGVALTEEENAFLEEAKLVANIFGTEPNLDITRQEILETHFNEDVLHFSCHGYFDSKDPLSSGIVLKNEEFLTAKDIFSNNLKIYSHLVTLSACETGLSENKKGDELIGLARSFLYSGSQSLLVSLWNVSAYTTKELMVEFYSNLKKGDDKAKSLQKAQIKIMEKYDHPFFWAPFILIGDWK